MWTGPKKARGNGGARLQVLNLSQRAVYVSLIDPAIFEIFAIFCNIRKLASLNKRKNSDCDILHAVEKSQILQLRANLEASGQRKQRCAL